MLKKEENRILRRCDKELLCIEPWGKNSFRIRATQRHEFNPEDDTSALLKQYTCRVNITQEGTSTFIQNGELICELTRTGKLRFMKASGELLLEEYERIRTMAEEGRKEFNSALEIAPRTFESYESMDNYRLTLRFEACDKEKLFGMGQYQQPYLDLKGCTLELAHRNSQASIPFLLSDRGYGFLWNNPAIGSVSFGKNLTEWRADSTKQMDYWVTTGNTPAEIEANYSEVTGRVPMMPEYGMGFWQCKLRYQTQEEILNIAREYRRRELPIDVIVVDFFHWPHEGDWKFDEDYWPDPAGMVRELREMHIMLMVSIWPTVDGESENYEEMTELGYLTRSERGKRLGQLGNAAFIDVTNPDTRNYVWEKIKENYYQKGIHLFWLDEAEPELTGYEYQHYRFYRGADKEIGNIYPKQYARMVYEGMQAEGQDNIVNLLRCAWAGSQRYGALVWSGDIDSSFRSLNNQLRAGLNMGIAGIPWWTTDIGGFHGGNIQDPSFKELLIRWFEFGTFCPVMRLHGFREPFKEPLGTSGGGKCLSGADNEVWSYGEEVYEICRKYLILREKMRPYIRRIMAQAHENKAPVMRPLFFDFPADRVAWEVEDEYMFGPDILVAPILQEGARSRQLYLPDGEWRSLYDGTLYQGNNRIEAAASLDCIPVFIRKDKLDEVTFQ